MLYKITAESINEIRQSTSTMLSNRNFLSKYYWLKSIITIACRYLQALLLRSQIFRVRSWLPLTTLEASPKNLAAITFPECPVSVCWKERSNTWEIGLSCKAGTYQRIDVSYPIHLRWHWHVDRLKDWHSVRSRSVLQSEIEHVFPV